MSGTWKPLKNSPPVNASTMLLLTDGTVMAQDSGGVNWARLTPDATGSYINGTWSHIAPMHHRRLYYASAVLRDGRVFVSGGEYSDVPETNTTEIYDPLLDTWTEIPPPPGFAKVGDAPCCVLPDGRLLLGNIDDTRTVIFDPTTNAWSAGPNKDDASSEETWTLLGDETVLSVECSAHPKAEKYVAAADKWVSAGSTPVPLVEAASIEIGPAFLMPDGRVFAVGATGNTAIYTPPPIANQPGTWATGPTFGRDALGRRLGAKDGPGCLMPNGRVLCVAGPVDDVSGDYLSPTYFFEFDGVTLNRITDPPTSGGPPFVGRMLLVPSGDVFFANGSTQLMVYTPDLAADPAWKPQITARPFFVRPLGMYTLHGRQLNGLSQAVGYGDDASAATNYPLVRIRNLTTGNIRYCRTFDHSSMGVATGLTTQSTSFVVPFGIDLGNAEISVVANGIESAEMQVFVLPFIWHFPLLPIVNELPKVIAEPTLHVIGPDGLVPLEKDSAQFAPAQAALQQIADGFKTLETLGVTANKERVAIAAKVAPAVDPDLEKIEARAKLTVRKAPPQATA